MHGAHEKIRESYPSRRAEDKLVVDQSSREHLEEAFRRCVHGEPWRAKVPCKQADYDVLDRSRLGSTSEMGGEGARTNRAVARTTPNRYVSLCVLILIKSHRRKPSERRVRGCNRNVPRIDEGFPADVVHDHGDVQLPERFEQPLPLMVTLRHVGDEIPDVHSHGRPQLLHDPLHVRLVPAVYHEIKAAPEQLSSRRLPCPVSRPRDNGVWTTPVQVAFDGTRAEEVEPEKVEDAVDVRDCERSNTEYDEIVVDTEGECCVHVHELRGGGFVAGSR